VDDKVLRQFMDFVREQVEENLGMVLVFSVVSAAIEWLGEKSEELKLQREEDERRKKEEEEEAERVSHNEAMQAIEAFCFRNASKALE